jgi:AcrR family transcriptional regulator
VFDTTTAVAAAMRLFWAKGYRGAGLSDLTEAMEIAPPSLYSAFGNKFGLFRAAVDHYQTAFGGYVADTLAQPDSFSAVRELLRRAARHFSRPDWPSGCLVVLTSLESLTEGDEDLARFLMEQKAGLLRTLADRFRQGQEAGDVPASADPEVLARWIASAVETLAVAAREGVPCAELDRLADQVLTGWPRERFGGPGS